MYYPEPQFLYADTPVPKLTDVPACVYSTPGLGHIVQDYSFYVPMYTFATNVKEHEKSIESLPSRGGFELNAPLIYSNAKQKKRKFRVQKGHGEKTSKTKTDLTSASESHAIEAALNHPIQVVSYIFFYLVYTFYIGRGS